jgi:hypothetical protein
MFARIRQALWLVLNLLPLAPPEHLHAGGGQFRRPDVVYRLAKALEAAVGWVFWTRRCRSMASLAPGAESDLHGLSHVISTPQAHRIHHLIDPKSWQEAPFRRDEALLAQAALAAGAGRNRGP